MKRLKLYLPIIIVSVLIPLFYCLLDKLKFDKLYKIIIASIFCISLWIAYYQIAVMHKGNDIDKKIKRNRIIISFLIQFILCVLILFIPFMYEMQQPLDRGHHTPIEMLFIPAIILLEPFLNYLWCAFVNLIIVKMPLSIFRKIKGIKN